MTPLSLPFKQIKTPYFPKSFNYVAYVLILIALYLMLNHPVWAIVFVLMAAVMLTTHYVTEINLHTKTYSDYITTLFIRMNEEKGKFNSIQKIVITKGNYVQNVQTRVQSHTTKFSDYTATVLFDRNNTLDLLTDMDKKKLLTGTKQFATFMNVGVEDHTSSQPYWIDIDKY